VRKPGSEKEEERPAREGLSESRERIEFPGGRSHSPNAMSLFLAHTHFVCRRVRHADVDDDVNELSPRMEEEEVRWRDGSLFVWRETPAPDRHDGGEETNERERK